MLELEHPPDRIGEGPCDNGPPLQDTSVTKMQMLTVQASYPVSSVPSRSLVFTLFCVFIATISLQ